MSKPTRYLQAELCNEQALQKVESSKLFYETADSKLDEADGYFVEATQAETAVGRSLALARAENARARALSSLARGFSESVLAMTSVSEAGVHLSAATAEAVEEKKANSLVQARAWLFNPICINATLGVAMAGTTMGKVQTPTQIAIRIIGLVMGGSSTAILAVLAMARAEDLSKAIARSTVYVSILMCLAIVSAVLSSTNDNKLLGLGFALTFVDYVFAIYFGIGWSGFKRLFTG